MQNSSNNDYLRGADYSKYSTWKKVVAPNGAVYFKVPNTNYLYDPYLSTAKGRPVIFGDPTAEIDAAKKANSPMAQIVPMAMNIGGTVAANQLVNRLSPTPAPTAINWDPSTGRVLMNNGNITNGAGQVIGSATSPTSAAFVNGAMGGGQAAAPIGTAVDGSTMLADGTTAAAPQAIGSAANGGTMLSNGTTAGGAIADTGGMLSSFAPAGSDFAAMGTLGQVALPVGGVLGAYNLAKNWGHQSTFGGLSSGAATGAAIGSIIPGVGTVIGAGVGAALGGLSSMFHHKTTKQTEQDRWNQAGKGDLGQQMMGHDYFAGTLGETNRDEKYLTPDAIRYNPDNYNNVPEWDNWSKQQQDQFLSTMLNAGKVNERKGGIYYDDAFAKQTADKIRKDAAKPIVVSTPAGDGGSNAQALGKKLAKKLDKGNGN